MKRELVLQFCDRCETGPPVRTISSSGLASLRSAFRVAFHVPATDRNGDLFGPDAFAALETRLETVAGGWYRSHDVDGGWRSPDGTVWRETCRRYLSTVDETVLQRVASLIDSYVRDAFDQEAVYLEITPVLTSTF